MRTICLNIDADTFAKISEGTDPDKLNQAIGYLSRWALWNLKHAHVYLTGSASESGIKIVASYHAKRRGKLKYQIVGEWRGDYFGFYSP